MTHKIDVLVPVYNVAPFIEKCIESIESQTFRNFRILAVNDGSTDNSLEKLKKLKEKYNNIDIISQKNQGLSSTRNTLIKNSLAEYVAFIDSDDFVDNRYLETLINNMEKFSVSISVCARFLYFSENQIVFKSRNKFSNQYLNSVLALRAMNSFQSFDISMWGKLFKRELFDGITFPVGMNGEDFFVMPKLLAKGATFYDPVPLYYYRQRQGSITGGSDVTYVNVEAADDQTALCLKEFPSILPQALSSGAFWRLSVVNQYIKKEKNCPKNHLKAIRDYIKSTYWFVLKNADIPFYKKVQLTVFIFFPIKLYSTVIKKVHHYRRCMRKS